MTIDEARKAVGKRVVFTASDGTQKFGEIAMVVEPWVRVRYDGCLTAKSTTPKLLELATEEMRRVA